MQSTETRAGQAGRARSLMYLLVFVVLLQFGYPITQYGEVWTDLYMLLYAGIIFFGILVVRDEGQHVRGFVALGLIFAVFGIWFSFAQHSRSVTLAMLISVAAFMLALIISLARFIFRRGQMVGVDLITAAICVYLILGGFFGAICSTLEILDPGSFEDPATPGESPTWQQLVYYSYVHHGHAWIRRDPSGDCVGAFACLPRDRHGHPLPRHRHRPAGRDLGRHHAVSQAHLALHRQPRAVGRCTPRGV